MWFKNIQHIASTPWSMDLARFVEQRAQPLHRCSGEQKRNWVSPRKDGSLVFSLGQQWLIALRTEERILPSSVISDEVKERAEKLTDSQGYAPAANGCEIEGTGRRGTPAARLHRSKTTFAWIDPQHGWLAIDAGAPSTRRGLH